MQSFLNLLAQVRNGAFIDRAGAELSALVLAVRDTGKKGKISFELEIEPFKGDDVTLSITDKITVKPPQPEMGRTLMFAIADGELSRKDPRQPDMFNLRSVDDKKEIVDPETGEIKQTA